MQMVAQQLEVINEKIKSFNSGKRLIFPLDEYLSLKKIIFKCQCLSRQRLVLELSKDDDENKLAQIFEFH
ncbi:hypothetical protein Avbf_05423 [Armadillidium vulgare]|nr:hypothetical protein Avbf_05423 [Armadillidium vulgare]